MPPKVTPVAPVKPLPLMVTDVPPPVGPLVVPREVIDGAVTESKVKWSADEVAEVPVGVVTVISTVAAASARAVAIRRPSVRTVNEEAASSKLTALVPSEM